MHGMHQIAFNLARQGRTQAHCIHSSSSTTSQSQSSNTNTASRNDRSDISRSTYSISTIHGHRTDGRNGLSHFQAPHGLFVTISDLGEMLSFPCFTDESEKDQKPFFLFYIYACCFGLGLGLISTVICFMENYTALSKACIASAVGLSIALGIFQIALNTKGDGRLDRSCRRTTKSIIRNVGLLLIMAATLIGAISSGDFESVFMFCAVFSFSCYLIAFVGFAIRSYRRYSKRKAEMNSNRDPTDNARHSIPDVNVMYRRDNDLVRTNSRNSHGVNFEPLPILMLPPYSESIAQNIDTSADKPPEYSMIALEDGGIESPPYTVSPSEEVTSTEQPLDRTLPVTDSLNQNHNGVGNSGCNV